MSRSVWKGPFVDGYLLKKAETVRASGRNEIIRIWSRRSTILPQFVGLTFGVHNGQKVRQDQLRLGYMMNFSPTFQALVSASHDVHVEGQFKENFGLNLRFLKAF